MKKLFILMLMLLVAIPMVAKKKVKKEIVYSFYVEEPLNIDIKERYFDDAKIRINFDWSASSNTLLSVSIKNNTDARMCIEWENARIGGNHIFFYGDEYDYSIIPRPDEVVHAGDVTYKTITNRYSSSSRYSPIFNLDYLYNEGDSTSRTIIIPIRFGDRIIDYKIKLVAYIYRIYINDKKN